ncbi:MAG: hypothetical protein CL916_03715, partial [Deltaproteobacteria bacterium]|nr:hypothetical protein [Deltaproteobacteria bacterium]
MNLDTVRELLKKYNLDPEIEEELKTILVQEHKTEGSALEDDWMFQDSESEEENQPERYEDLALLGVGGMGEVRKVRDTLFNRELAMKIIHPQVQRFPAGIKRFMEEAHIVGQLQHPSIVPVFDKGRLSNGRLFFTMSEIRGQELSSLIEEYHHARKEDDPIASSLRQRLLNIFHQVCTTMSYAHDKGIVHRDLKPENIMIGAHGEVLVVDWGIAKVMHQEDISLAGMEEFSYGEGKTQVGQVTGTPAYMSPEQASGCVDDIDERSDIFTLGVILFEILLGVVPNEQTRLHLTNYTDDLGIVRVNTEQLQIHTSTQSLPKSLREICLRCIQKNPDNRFQTSTDLAKKIQEFLDGVMKREEALQIFKKGRRTQQEEKSMRKEAKRRKEKSEKILRGLASWEPEEKKWAAWEEEERAELLFGQASLKRVESETLFHAALEQFPELSQAHEALIEEYLAEHRKAEEHRDTATVAQYETRLIHHIQALPEESTNRAKYQQYIHGLGAVSIHTTPPGALVFVEHYQNSRRRKMKSNRKLLGTTPLDKISLQMGSYVLTICKEGYKDTIYPIQIRRLEHWDGIPNQSSLAREIPLMKEDILGEDDVYIPAGYFVCGGDDKAYHPLRKERIWVDGFVMRRFPVTHGEYLVFLNDLCKKGLVEMAHTHAPRKLGDAEKCGYEFELGCFSLHNTGLSADWPACMLTWFDCQAYTKWYAEKTSVSWRLPTDYEWEKAAKGTDGRIFPWGEHFDASFSCMDQSHPKATPTSIYDFTADESPYGVRGMAGNVR